MKLWLIGKRGMLSQALQRICTKRRIDYLATSRKEVDVCDPKVLKHQFDTLEFSHVINCSGYTAVDRAEEEQNQAKKLNIDAVETLGTLARDAKVKLIHFSTDYVFDGKKTVPYREEDEPNPLSFYGQTKWMGEERLLRVFPEACIIRSSWLFGKEGSHFVRTMIELMKQHESLQIISDQRGRPTFCDDLAHAALDLIDHRGIYHFANRGDVSWLEFAEEILKQLQENKKEIKCRQIHSISSQEYRAAAKRPPFSVLKTDKYERATKKTPRKWQEALKDYLSCC